MPATIEVEAMVSKGIRRCVKEQRRRDPNCQHKNKMSSAREAGQEEKLTAPKRGEE
jgi:hypothetical protein